MCDTAQSWKSAKDVNNTAVFWKTEGNDNILTHPISDPFFFVLKIDLNLKDDGNLEGDTNREVQSSFDILIF